MPNFADARGRAVGSARQTNFLEVVGSSPTPAPNRPQSKNIMAKRLTLQIDRPCFKDILNGVQKVEHRYIYPSNAKKYVIQTEREDGGLDVTCVPYDELYLINGRRKDAPRLTVKVERAEFVIFTNEKGEDLTYMENGEEWLVCQVWYYLGDVVSYENADGLFYDEAEKAKRLAVVSADEAELEASTVDA